MWLESNHVKVTCQECGKTKWLRRSVRYAEASLFKAGWCLVNPDMQLASESKLLCSVCVIAFLEDGGWA